MRRFYILLSVTGFAVFGGLFFFGPRLAAPPAEAVTNYECSDGVASRWFTDSAMFDVGENRFPGWWRDEIIAAQAVWDAPSVGADFDFLGSSESVNEWTMQTNHFINEAGVSSLSIAD